MIKRREPPAYLFSTTPCSMVARKIRDVTVTR